MRSPTRAEWRRRNQRLGRLLEKRRCEIAEQVWLREISPTEVDEVRDREDEAVEDLRHEMELALAQIRSHTLQGIEEAIRRLERGRYGVCGDCGATLSRARLRALPFAALCRDCQAEGEAERRASDPRERGVAVRLSAL